VILVGLLAGLVDFRLTEKKNPVQDHDADDEGNGKHHGYEWCVEDHVKMLQDEGIRVMWDSSRSRPNFIG
jgi:hypothetical protein